MKKKSNFSDILKEIEPLRKDNAETMTGGFAPFGGQDQVGQNQLQVQQQQSQLQTMIMNSVLVGVLGYACACNCQCAC